MPWTLASKPPTSSPASSESSRTPPAPASPGPSPDDETTDALRRTRLASERTYLAWWRTALTALAVGIGTGGIAPKLGTGERWAYVGVGTGFAALGILLFAYGLRRQLTVDRAVAEGRFAPPDRWVLAVLAVAGATLGVLTIVLLAFSL